MQFGQVKTGIIPKPQGFVLRFLIGHEIYEGERKLRRHRLRARSCRTSSLASVSPARGLQLVVNLFGNREGPLIQNRPKHSDIRSL
jgi:hypothetical protein